MDPQHEPPDQAHLRPEGATDDLPAGRRHLLEAEMKERRRTHGRPWHESRPDEGTESPGE